MHIMYMHMNKNVLEYAPLRKSMTNFIEYSGTFEVKITMKYPYFCSLLIISNIC